MEFCKAGCSWWKLNYQTLMKTVWFSDPVMSGLSLPRTNRSSSTGHLSDVNPTVSTFCNVSNVNDDLTFDQPGLNFTDGDIPKSLRTSVWHASPCLRTVAWGVNLQKANFNQVRRIFPFLLQSFPLCQLYLGGVVISSPNYINLLLKEFSWVSLFFRSAMQFW